MPTSDTTRGYGPAIKLFGRTISIASEQQVEELRDGGTELRMMTPGSWVEDKDSRQEALAQDAIPAPHHTLSAGDNTCAPKGTSKNTHHQLSATEHKHAETKNGMPPLTTPVKALPCPRCTSQDTKFCYYNNYNINQPRYLCKDCRRYWTAGGATRDVPPAAAGSRKRNIAAAGRQCSSSTYDHHSDSAEFTVELGPSSRLTDPTLTKPISTSSSATATTGIDNTLSYGSNSEGRVAAAPCAVDGAPAGPFPWAPSWNNMNATMMADSCVCTSGMVYRQIGGGNSSNNTSTAASRSLGLFAWTQMVPIMTTAVFAVPVVCNPSFQTSFGLWNSTPWLPPAYGGQFSGNRSCTSRVEECTAESVTMCVPKKRRVVRDP